VVNYLGYPGTTGCDGFDYNIVDASTAPPEISTGFNERLVYLPYNYQANDMPLHVMPCTKHGAKTCPNRIDIGDAGREGVVRLCSFNANKKIEPYSFSGVIHIVICLVLTLILLHLIYYSILNSLDGNCAPPSLLYSHSPRIRHRRTKSVAIPSKILWC
jgi:hypothetical protein